MQRVQIELVCKPGLACVSSACFFALKEVHNMQTEDVHMSLGAAEPPTLVLWGTEPLIKAELGRRCWRALPPLVRAK